MLRTHIINVDIATMHFDILNAHDNRIYIFQSDNRSNIFEFNIYKNGTPFDIGQRNLTLYVRKPNGVTVYTGDFTINQNHGVAILDTGFTNVNGTHIFELHLNQNDIVLSILQFECVIKRSISDLYAELPSSQLSLIEEMNKRLTALENSSKEGQLHDNIETLNGLSEKDGVLQFNGVDVDKIKVFNWSEIQDKPTSFTPSQHNHDTQYASIVHTHDYNNLTNKPTIPIVTNDLTNVLKANYDSAYVHSQTIHFDGDYNNLKNKPVIPPPSDVTKNYVDVELAKKRNIINITTKTISGNTLTLGLEALQILNGVIPSGTTISLPTATNYIEIRLIITTGSTAPTLTMPNIKWQNTPLINANKTYEICFTWLNTTIGWLGGIIQYG